ncbi:acyltransferase [Chryseobacterium sp. G0162]|uniref:acyltransferase family protein n=1 Tax=Chryseobacterium sp. G0162 TaxID=2487063 RepID=UPI000F4F2B17|nr:acyltransferase [Chryseobacterium sp. G0162]AZB09709.1 acyltransferase [Chryseobacterium sp. G0162]
MAEQRNRILVLDGLRGLAILLVFLFHGYYIWEKNYPFGGLYKDNILVKYGDLGVQLFFLISGFVILMSMEKTPGFIQFIKNRWVRLFPSMLICSVIIYITAGFFSERPLGIPELKSLLPGILFVDEGLLERVFKTDFPVLESSFWSLYIEVKFYVIFGALYYLFKRNLALLGIFIIYLVAVSYQILEFHHLLPLELLKFKAYIGNFVYFGWFVSGALIYIYYKERDKRYLYAFVIATICAMFYMYRLQDMTRNLYLMMLVLIFVGALFWDKMERFFSMRLFTFIGFVSYPVYLLHENMMISWMVKIDKHIPVPYWLLPIISFSLVIPIAYLVAKYLEPPIQKKLKVLLKNIK